MARIGAEVATIELALGPLESGCPERFRAVVEVTKLYTVLWVRRMGAGTIITMDLVLTSGLLVLIYDVFWHG